VSTIGRQLTFDLFGDVQPEAKPKIDQVTILGTAFFQVTQADRQMRTLDTLAEAMDEIGTRKDGQK
jgi:hypothetical protein